MENIPSVYIVVLNYNGRQITIDCVNSVLKIDYPNFNVIVVDNASTDDSVAQFREAFTDPRIELLVNDRNEGYAGGNNRGIERALSQGAEYVFILNNDTIAEPDCLGPLVEAMQQDPKLGACGCPISNIGPEGLPNFGQEISLYTGGTRAWHDPDGTDPCRKVDYICGAAILLRASTIRKTGPFDPAFFLLFEDADLCFRIREAGFGIRMAASSGVRHLESRTRSRFPALVKFYGIRNRAWFIRRHGRWYHRGAFALLQFLWLLPRQLVGCAVRARWDLIGPVLRGYRDGLAHRSERCDDT